MSSRREQQKLEDAIRAHQNGEISSYTLNRRIRDFQKATQQDQVSEFREKGGPGQYGFRARANRALARATKGLGKMGDVLHGLFAGKDQGFQPSQIAAAAELIREYQKSTLVANLDEIAELCVDALEGNEWSLERAKIEMQKAEEGSRQWKLDNPPPPESEYQRGNRRATTDEDPGPRMTPKHLTPGSSNVQSFQYDMSTSTLYVTFQSPTINSKSVDNYISSGGLPAIAGDMGKTITGKDKGGSGYTYAYRDVPIKIYKRLIADQSAGGDHRVDPKGGVWGRLRERGSMYGTQYPYSLVAGAVVPGEDGDPAIYVPRKATAGGYKSRSVAQPGQGRRQYVSSTLPQDMRGHSTINQLRHRPSRPNRGRPEPPSRGR